MKLTTLIFCCLITAANLCAQNNPVKIDVVLMKNGDRYVGQLLEYEQGGQVKIRLLDGRELDFKDSRVHQILQGVAYDEVMGELEDGVFDDERLIAKQKGLYASALLPFAVGAGTGEGLTLGAGFSAIFGYQLKPVIGLGVGFGIDNYARRGETIYPVFAELRSFLPDRQNQRRFYVTVAGGYGFAFKRESIGISEAKGGYMFHPAVGYRTPTRQGVDVNVDLGIKIQDASFTRNLFNGDIEIRDITYRRFVVRVGLSFWGK